MAYFKTILKRILEQFFGTSINEWRWKRRHLVGGDDWKSANRLSQKNAWVKSYWDSMSHPHRTLLIDTIGSYRPSRILEVGSNCGPNLYLLAKRFPKATIKGIDINEASIEAGNTWLKKEDIRNVTLLHRKADQLNSFEEGAFDIVFTDAVLIYVGPDKIKTVARQMLRIAKKALILVEWQCAKGENDPEGLGIYYGGRWKRNYANLFASLSPKTLVRTKKLSHSDWPDANWSSIGYIIKINKPSP